MSSTASRQSEGNHVHPRYQASIDFLFSRINYERSPELAKGPQSFRLERMRSLLQRIDDPQFRIPCIHIAGSKGKGSTATMIARILEESGQKVGLFTSPHAHRFEERFTINEQLPTEDQVVAIIDRLRLVTQEMDDEAAGGPTFFELATAAGWLHFVQQQVDIAVIEVGLGGRLDSTNVCSPLVCVITSISKDHTRLLGDTLELIAREKAGILKNGIPVINGVLNEGPLQVIQEHARQVNAPLWQLGTDFKISASVPAPDAISILPTWSFDYSQGNDSLKNVMLAMPGEHQTRNAALAIAAVKLLRTSGCGASDAETLRGLSRAIIPLRVEIVQREPVVVIDAAHNSASIAALCSTLQPLQVDKKFCLFASSRDKDCAEMLHSLDGHFDEFILCAYQENPRAIPIEELQEIAQTVLTRPFHVAVSPGAGMEWALQTANSNDMVCATGSFFLAAEVERWWSLRNDPGHSG